MSKINKSICIAGRKIGKNYPPYIVAEMSANHNGSFELAKETIEMAGKMGADAIKLQTYTPDTLTIDSDQVDFQIKGGLWDGLSLYQLYKKAHTPFEWHKELFDHARKVGITCFSTPFDESAVDLLEELNAPAYKIASFEIIDLPLIRYVAQTKKPMILSTGMANLEEIGEAVNEAHSIGCEEIALLHCTSGYPVPPEQADLRTINDLEKRFDVVCGLSDHTIGTAVSVVSVALGSCIIEKHFKVSRSGCGPDSSFSIEPDELKRLCSESKIAWTALGKVSYARKNAEVNSIKYRRSVYAVKDIEPGNRFNKNNIRRIRPGYGLLPKYYEELIGRKAKVKIERGSALKWEYIDTNEYDKSL